MDFNSLIYTGRGSTSIYAILKALNKPNARVLLPVNICEIVIPVILSLDMYPAFYDVNELTGNAELSDIVNAYTSTENILLVVHNFGRPVEIDKIAEWAKIKDVFLIEDVCNALGATYKGTPLGDWGDAAVFSFGYVKIIEYGVGGAAKIKNNLLHKEVLNIISKLDIYSDFLKNKDIEFQNRIRLLRNDPNCQNPNYYLPFYIDYAKYILYSIPDKDISEIKKRLKNLNINIKRRNNIAETYRQNIKSNYIKHIEPIEGQTYWRYNLLVDISVRNNLLKKLREENILASTWYPPIAHLFFNDFDMISFPKSYLFTEKVINLFVDYRIDKATINKTIDIINQF